MSWLNKTLHALVANASPEFLPSAVFRAVVRQYQTFCLDKRLISFWLFQISAETCTKPAADNYGRISTFER